MHLGRYRHGLFAAIMQTMWRPFIIHAHSGQGELHYDLMLSQGDVLATWQLQQSPEEMVIGRSIPARKLPDHRKAYLTYQGPVRGGRGEVAMLDEGGYELLTKSPHRWEFHLGGRKVFGRYELLHPQQGTDTWILRRLPDN